MGVVWRAWRFYPPSDPRSGEPPFPLALKLLPAQAQDNAEMRGLLASEAQAQSLLNHPNIVAFYDFFEWGGALVLLMELVAGSTLEALLARHHGAPSHDRSALVPGLPAPRAWYYFQQLLGALAATHALGLVHRDVKPANVLLRSDGIVKLSDFGLARFRRATPATTAPMRVPTPAEVALLLAPGTGAYMAPEQVLGRPLDARSDLYSAAVVFYEMLAGRPPFQPADGDEASVRRSHLEDPPPPLRDFVRDAPVALEAALARALAKDPRYRFASAVDLGEALRLALGARETPEWRALVELAGHASVSADEGGRAVREARLGTLRLSVVQGYQAAYRGM
jgi:serine/threonine-protein kinase